MNTTIYYKSLNYLIDITLPVKLNRQTNNCLESSRYTDQKLINALEQRDLDVIKVLVPKCQQQNILNFYFLEFASDDFISYDLILLLLPFVNIRYDNSAMIKIACENGHERLVSLLLQVGANANDNYCLLWASYNGYYKVVKVLLDSHVDVNAEDGFSLKWAARNGHLRVVKLLISKGASYKNEALKWSCLKGHRKIALLLIRHGAIITEDIIKICNKRGYYSFRTNRILNKKITKYFN